MKHFTLTVTVVACLTLLVIPESAFAWWGFIHCWGNADLHGNANPPQRETDGQFREQCHGKEGDNGSCEDTIEDATFYVNCYQVPGGTKCLGHVTCPGSSSPNMWCGGADEVFSGSRVGNGYLVCKKDGEVFEVFECGIQV